MRPLLLLSPVAALLGVAFLGTAGCATDTAPARERGALFAPRVQELKAPLKDRCSTATGENLKPCLKARQEAQMWARHLSPGDMICLENGVGEEPTDTCVARAATMDNAMNRVLVEVRSARPESKYFDRQQAQIWFEEGALVDLYLNERGY